MEATGDCRWRFHPMKSAIFSNYQIRPHELWCPWGEAAVPTAAPGDRQRLV
jgi:hypothetical protein